MEDNKLELMWEIITFLFEHGETTEQSLIAHLVDNNSNYTNKMFEIAIDDLYMLIATSIRNDKDGKRYHRLALHGYLIKSGIRLFDMQDISDILYTVRHYGNPDEETVIAHLFNKYDHVAEEYNYVAKEYHHVAEQTRTNLKRAAEMGIILAYDNEDGIYYQADDNETTLTKIAEFIKNNPPTNGGKIW